MAGKPIEVIRVEKGKVNRPSVTVEAGWGVTWVPATTDVKVKVKFKNASPFEEGVEFPDTPEAGQPVAARVKSIAFPTTYAYNQPGSSRRRRGARPLDDPVIIVRDNRVRKGKKRAKKVARKK